MKTDIVEFSTALLARDKGYINGSDFYFDINTEHLFVWNDMIGSIGCKNGDNPEQIEAPYRAELQKWLRDEHGMHIEIDFRTDDIENKYKLGVCEEIAGQKCYWIIESGYTTYENALEEGLKKGLTSI